MNQTDMFGAFDAAAMSRPSDPSTSHNAAAGVDTSRSRQLVRDVFDSGDSLTDDQAHESIVARGEPITPQSVRRERKALLDSGWLEVVGAGVSLNGGKCRVYRMVRK